MAHHRAASRLLAGAVLSLVLPAAAQPTAPGRTVSSATLRDAAAWPTRMNDAVVGASASGLRVEVAPGRTWAIAAAEGVRAPAGLAVIRVRVGQVRGGGRWLARLYGDLRGTGTPATISLFERRGEPGTAEFAVNPGLLRGGSGSVVQLQLGIEGEAGAAALFEDVQFIVRRQPRSPAIAGQRPIRVVEAMPNLPTPYRMLDWRRKARDLDAFLFDFGARGRHLPLVWLDTQPVNTQGPTFGLPSYVGDAAATGRNHEGITCMGAVLGATLVGIDKRRQKHDYVAMCEEYYGQGSSPPFVMNRAGAAPGGSFWYDLCPHLLWYALTDRYPDRPGLARAMRATADRWRDAAAALDGKFDHLGFDFGTMKPTDNGQWREPDAAAGAAWLTYMAWRRFGDRTHLAAADLCMARLQARRTNPYYEMLLPYGAYLAARMNAEEGRSYDVDRLVQWSFGVSDCRGGWGVVVGRWGGHDVSGLCGSVDNLGGYAFAMNTYMQAGALVPMVRYDARYARAIGKWMLNLSNAARLFFPNETPNQCCPPWPEDARGLVGYEGLRHAWQGKTPCATGDPVAMEWGPQTDRGIYGSVFVGVLGAIVNRTSDSRVLALDCLATDYFRDRAYPTFLLYNPYGRARTVTLDVGARRRDVYDAATHRFVARGVRGRAKLTIPGDRALVAVLPPAGGKAVRAGRTVRVDGVVVDWAAPAPPRRGDARP